jgi:hypothetical protein
MSAFPNRGNIFSGGGGGDFCPGIFLSALFIALVRRTQKHDQKPRGCAPPPLPDGVGHGGVWLAAGKRRRGDDNGKEVGVTWELVGLAMARQVAVKWSTTGEWRALG